MSKCKLTQERLMEIVRYIPSSGLFIRMRNSKRWRIGQVMGSFSKIGYITMWIDGKSYYAHRLAWLYMTGKWPENEIDHIDHNRCNNVWGNLREVTRKENRMNVTLLERNSSGFTGVRFDKENNKWLASIGVNGKNVNLGRFSNIVDAIECRKKADIKYGFHANHGIDLEKIL
jgi:hypothetical protein